MRSGVVGLFSKHNKTLAFIVAGLLCMVGLAFFASTTTYARGETFNWESSDYIRMSGGNYADVTVRGSNTDPVPFRGDAPNFSASRSLTVSNNPGGGSASATCSLFLDIRLAQITTPTVPGNPNSSHRDMGPDPTRGTLMLNGSRSGDHENCRTVIDNYLNETPRDDGSIAIEIERMRLIRSLAQWFGIAEDTCDYNEGFPTRQRLGTECQREMRSKLTQSINLSNANRYLPDAVDCFTFGPGEQGAQACLAEYYREVESGDRELNIGQGGEPEEAAEEENASVCAGGPLGWITCPFVFMLAGIIEGIANVMDSLLFVEPLDLSTDSPMYQLWSVFRNIANVVFIIVFLVIIFSQITSMGLSNYGIKSILPRLVIAAVMVNISYFVCAIAIDAFNLIGRGVEGIMQAGINAVPDPQASTQFGLDWSRTWGTIISSLMAILILGAAGGAAVAAALLGAQVVPIILSGLLAVALPVLIAFAIIVLRHVFIILLVLLSPLAFVSMLLPGTNSFYSKWQSAFLTILFMYPIIMLALFGSILGAKIILTVNYTTDWLAFLIALITLAAGPVIIIAAPKLAGALLSRFTGFINNPSKGLIDRGKNATSTWLGDRRGAEAADYDPNAGGSWWQRTKSAARSGRIPRLTERERKREAARTQRRGDKWEGEELALAQDALSQRGITRNRAALKRVIEGPGYSSVMKTAAMYALGETGDTDGLLTYLNGGDDELRKKAAKAAVKSSSIRQSGGIIADQAQAYLDLIQEHPDIDKSKLWNGASTDANGNPITDANGNPARQLELDERDANGNRIKSAAFAAQEKARQKMGAEFLASQKPSPANLANINKLADDGGKGMRSALLSGLSNPNTRPHLNDNAQEAIYREATGGNVANASHEENIALMNVAGSTVAGQIASHYSQDANFNSLTPEQQNALSVATGRAVQNNPGAAGLDTLSQRFGGGGGGTPPAGGGTPTPPTPPAGGGGTP